MTSTPLQRQVQQFVRTKFGGDPQLSDELISLEIDSLGMAELAGELESHFQVRIGDDVNEVQTIGELAQYIACRQQQQQEK